MKLIFTICSNNYLGQAKALGDSILLTNPDYKFIIGLVDHLAPEIDYENEIGHMVVPCHEIGIPDFDSLWMKYNIIELNTCVKPFYLQYFTEKYGDLTYIMYFDPDTYVFGNLEEIENELLGEKEILVTPHILTPIPLDNKSPAENLFLNYGIYNLGFIAIKNPLNNTHFFQWWGERTYNVGFNRAEDGLFVDQLWINLIPIFYNNVIVSKNFGLNMAPWNLHERFLSIEDNGEWKVNESANLIFFHFSSFYYHQPERIASSYGRYNFSIRPDLVLIYSNYLQALLSNNVSKLSQISCIYVDMRNKAQNQHLVNENDQTALPSLSSRFKDRLNRFLSR